MDPVRLRQLLAYKWNKLGEKKSASHGICVPLLSSNGDCGNSGPISRVFEMSKVESNGYDSHQDRGIGPSNNVFWNRRICNGKNQRPLKSTSIEESLCLQKKGHCQGTSEEGLGEENPGNHVKLYSNAEGKVPVNCVWPSSTTVNVQDCIQEEGNDPVSSEFPLR